ncbi:MAG: hypothetical protein OEY22_10890 [Candidatus Bathyarchaeota archaeon]|nr:hypothetical protein [Candidatus Bathyarchaeota archaeon]MDH5787584.1 hypothetical protein [Candidatus Bathyarchaeota archaeon]
MRNKKNIFFQHLVYRSFSRIARKLQGRDFVKAESFQARDKICRVFAAECFELAENFAKQKKQKLALQYMKLSCKLLNLSLRPKKLADLEEIKKALEKLQAEGQPE